ncbi:MAG: ATP-binding cassette domain-containing protein, partial [Calditrichaeota bacterium]|nr:ATP-binding cassette domain-containing protein [Calditrichota bacterium]
MTPPPASSSLVTLKNVSFARGGRSIIDKVSLDVAPGESLTIIGPNGAGKTTLLTLMLGLEKPDSGTIQRREGLRLAYMPQKLSLNPLMPLDVYGFLELTNHASHTAIHAALDMAGAGHCCNVSMHTLSGGEFQRVLLA